MNNKCCNICSCSSFHTYLDTHSYVTTDAVYIHLEKQAPGTLLEIILSSLSIGRDFNAKLSIFNFSNVAMYLLTTLMSLHMYVTIFNEIFNSLAYINVYTKLILPYLTVLRINENSFLTIKGYSQSLYEIYTHRISNSLSY